jgi:hypothetical protein
LLRVLDGFINTLLYNPIFLPYYLLNITIFELPYYYYDPSYYAYYYGLPGFFYGFIDTLLYQPVYLPQYLLQTLFDLPYYLLGGGQNYYYNDYYYYD